LRKFLRDTRELIDSEIRHYKKAYELVLKEYHNKDEYDKKDQLALKRSNEVINKKLSRVNRLELLKSTLEKEIKTLIKAKEKAEKESQYKLKNAVEKYREVIAYLERELDSQRSSHEETIELFRTLEKTLRDTVYRCENAEARIEVLQEELKKSKRELHEIKNKSFEEVSYSFDIVID
jgi:hypothetical protein